MTLIELMCRAYDREDAAQRGEPDPWAANSIDQSDTPFARDRIVCMVEAFKALRSYASTQEAVPTRDRINEAIMDNIDLKGEWIGKLEWQTYLGRAAMKALADAVIAEVAE